MKEKKKRENQQKATAGDVGENQRRKSIKGWPILVLMESELGETSFYLGIRVLFRSAFLCFAEGFVRLTL